MEENKKVKVIGMRMGYMKALVVVVVMVFGEEREIKNVTCPRVYIVDERTSIE